MQNLSNLLNIKFITVVFFLGILVSCQPEDSADVNQNRIYTHYELFYNSNEDKTHAVARFHFGNPGGTLLELKDPALVTFNGDQMAYSLVYNGHHKEYGGFISSGTFEYTNVDGLVYTNSVDTFDIIAFPANLDTVAKSNAYTLNWNGNPLSANEHVGVFIGSWTWGDDALFIQNEDAATNIVMGTNALANLSTGPSIFFMDRSKNVATSQAPDAGGAVVGKYRALNKTVQIVD